MKKWTLRKQGLSGNIYEAYAVDDGTGGWGESKRRVAEFHCLTEASLNLLRLLIEHANAGYEIDPFAVDIAAGIAPQRGTL